MDHVQVGAACVTGGVLVSSAPVALSDHGAQASWLPRKDGLEGGGLCPDQEHDWCPA